MTLELVNKCKHLVVSYILHNFDKEIVVRSEEHTSELQSQSNLVCRLLLEKKNIAREIGVSRSTVWRWVQRLRELGVRAKGHPRTGYFLEKVPDLLTPDVLKRHLQGSVFAKHIHHFLRIDSTNRMAMELGYANEPEGTVVLAEEQTAGRGRAGRAWHSERGTGNYATVLLRPKISPVQAPLLTMMAGLSARAAVHAQTGP